jgi:phage tail-like protein
VRGTVDGLQSPHPLGAMLPPIYYEDAMAQQLTAGLDGLLAPIFSALDNLDSYLDPQIAPPDFVGWLAGWVGLALDQTWPADRQRALIEEASTLYAWRGTVRGLAAHVRLYLQVEPEIEESGGASWSPVPGGAVPGSPEPYVRVRVRVSDPTAVDTRRLDAVVSSAKPAHVPHEIEVVAG